LFSNRWSTTQQGGSTVTWIRAENSSQKLAVSIEGGLLGLGIETGLLANDSKSALDRGRQVTLRADQDEPFAASVMPLRDHRFYWIWDASIFAKLRGRDRLTVQYALRSGEDRFLEFDISRLEIQLQNLGVSDSAIDGQVIVPESPVLIR
jgi:hypothetical protein